MPSSTILSAEGIFFAIWCHFAGSDNFKSGTKSDFFFNFLNFDFNSMYLVQCRGIHFVLKSNQTRQLTELLFLVVVGIDNLFQPTIAIQKIGYFHPFEISTGRTVHPYLANVTKTFALQDSSHFTHAFLIKTRLISIESQPKKIVVVVVVVIGGVVFVVHVVVVVIPLVDPRDIPLKFG